MLYEKINSRRTAVLATGAVAVLAVLSMCLLSISVCSDDSDAAVGNTFTVGDLKYTVTSETDTNTVSVISCDKNATSVTIPSTVDDGGKTYSVTSINYGAFFGCTALASFTVDGGNTHYKAVDGVLLSYDGKTLVAYPAGRTDTSYNIPGGVTFIGSGAFDDCTHLTSVTFSSNVTSFGQYAFQYCTALTSVTIPDSVTSIGSYVFYNCTALTSVTIGSGVKSIGSSAFSGCTALASFTVDGGNTYYKAVDGVLLSYDGKTLIAYPAARTDTSYNIPEGVISICDYAFQDCTALTSVTIPDSVTSIGGYAFHGCTHLTSVAIGSGVTSIESSAFSSCTALKSVTIGSGVTSIGDYAFHGCTALASFTVDGGNTHYKAVDGVLLSYDGKTLVAYPAGRTDTSYNIPEGVTYICGYAFFGCTHLTSVAIPDSVTTIGDYAFFGCTHLTSVAIGSGLTSISDYSFNSCASLTSVAIPDSVTTIGGYAFMYCTALTSVAIGSGLTSIGYYAFFGCSALASFTVDGGNTYYKAEKGVLFSADGTIFISYPEAKADASYNIPDTVTSIDDYAFHGCTHLISVAIPDSVTSIGSYAFQDCTTLTSVSIGSGVTSIGSYAFFGCTSMASFTVGSGNTHYKTVDGVLFSYGGETLVAYPAARTDTSYNIPEGVISICGYAFQDCTALTSVTIPDSVTSIGSDAFYGCTGLTAFDVAKENADYKAIGGVLFSADGTILISYPSARADVSYRIPDIVTSIESDAFSNAKNLMTVTIGSGVKSIGYSAFYGCTGLTAFDVVKENTYYKAIGGVLFSADGKTLCIFPEAKGGRYEIPEVVTTIEINAMANNKHLTAIVIPRSLSYVDETVFMGCSNLTTVIIYSPEVVGHYELMQGFGNDETVYCTVYTDIKNPEDSIVSVTNNGYGNVVLQFKSLDELPSRSNADDNTMLYVGIGAVAAIVLAGAAFFLLRRR
jgi:hypothetical protein